MPIHRDGQASVLLPRPRQQLGLSLNREINQQRPELKQLLTVDHAPFSRQRLE